MVMSWKTGGLLLGLVFFVAVLLVKPIGVSTQFVILDGIIWDAFSTELVTESETSKSGYASTNAYLNKSGGKYAKSVANPVNYGFIFVIAMMAGAALSALASGGVQSGERVMPDVWRQKFGDHKGKRYLISLLAGFIALFGARLAGGCTSGHMMSGMMQTALSGYIFTAGVFLIGIPLAMYVFREQG